MSTYLRKTSFRLLQAGFLCGSLSGVASAAAAQSLLVANGTVIDVRTGLSKVQDVLVIDGVIRAVGNVGPVDSTIARVDAGGKWVVPGFIEAHTHTTDTSALRRALGLGITSTLTIRTPPDTADLGHSSALPATPMPREYTVAGRFSGGFPRPLPGRWAPQTPAEVTRYLDALRIAGFLRIKIWMDDFSLQRDERVPVLDNRVFQALLDGARARGMEVYVHALEGRWYRAAVAGGATWVIHPMFPDTLTTEDAHAMVTKGMGRTSGMSVVQRLGDARALARRYLADPRLAETLSSAARLALEDTAALDENPGVTVRPLMVDRHEEYLRVIARNGHVASREGVVLSVGSDSQVGIGTHVEVELLRDYGFDAVTILRALTLGGAVALGVEHRFGTIEAGWVADMVILGSDPLADITNVRDVEHVVKGGHVWRATLLRR